MLLTISAQIPTHARGTVRATVKAHPAWKAFLAENNMISADAKNQDLIELALRHPRLKAQIEQILTQSSPKELGPPCSIEEIAALARQELRASGKVRNLVQEIEYQMRRVYGSKPAKLFEGAAGAGKARVRVKAGYSSGSNV